MRTQIRLQKLGHTQEILQNRSGVLCCYVLVLFFFFIVKSKKNVAKNWAWSLVWERKKNPWLKDLRRGERARACTSVGIFGVSLIELCATETVNWKCAKGRQCSEIERVTKKLKQVCFVSVQVKTQRVYRKLLGFF